MHYIGLMSGTSADGIDAALVSVSSDDRLKLVTTLANPFPAEIRNNIHSLMLSGDDEIERLGQLDMALGEMFADTANAVMRLAGMDKKNIRAIGCHGQTLRHRPRANHPFTLQIGNAAVIAERTGITTVSNFRARDIAVRGGGAPLVPVLHQKLFHSPKKNRVIVNIGGIANITYLPANGEKPVSGFDTGPGNTLLDLWVRHHNARDRDEAGQWAATGKFSQALLQKLLTDPYFQVAPPKSTGREHFNLAWLIDHLEKIQPKPPAADVQATLVRLTAHTIAEAVRRFLPHTQETYVCGGGTHNRELMSALQLHFSGMPLATTEILGLHPDWVEAVAFAWLAHLTLEGRPGNLPSVTGAQRAVILGGIFPA